MTLIVIESILLVFAIMTCLNIINLCLCIWCFYLVYSAYRNPYSNDSNYLIFSIIRGICTALCLGSAIGLTIYVLTLQLIGPYGKTYISIWLF